VSQGEPDLTAVERSLEQLFVGVRATESAPDDLWRRVAPRLQTQPPAFRWPSPRWRLAAAMGIALVAAAAFLALTRPAERTASAEEILQRAELAATSPGAVGIESLVVSTRSVTYFLEGEDAGRLSFEYVSQVWYAEPGRLRFERSATRVDASGGRQEGTWLSVWDGVHRWFYDPTEARVDVWRQGDVDLYRQAAAFGGAPAEASPEYLSTSCRSSKVIGAETIAGRETDIVELSRPHCGLQLPGHDGRRVLWVDRETGLALQTEFYTLAGDLFGAKTVTSFELNGQIDPERFTFEPPSNAQLNDRRDQPPGMGAVSAPDPPPVVSLADARRDASFDLRVPAWLPDGFELESVEHYWGSERARELRSHADWVLLRYANEHGEWLFVTQGFGGLLHGLAFAAPEEARRGTVDVNGADATWIDGSPTNSWELGTMTLLHIDAGRLGSGWEVTAGGERIVGSPSHLAFASNVLAVETLVRVAESMD
jgi:outer membrane lipoprotein-sorting protein